MNTGSILSMDMSFLLGGRSAMPNFESAKVRIAKAAFTTKTVEAPWNTKRELAQTLLTKLSEAKRTRNFVDPITSVDGRRFEDPDLTTAFTVFKALDRLGALAKTAAQKGLTDIERTALNKIFQTGLTQVEDYLATQKGDKLSFAFSKPASSATTKVLESSVQSVSGAGFLATRSEAIPGIVGNEVLRINLHKGTSDDFVDVDLSTISGPITLDAVAGAVNTAIAGIPLVMNGVPVLDANGDPKPKYLSQMTVKKDGEKWGFSFNTIETEKVSLSEVTAGDALIVSAGQTMLEGPTASRVLKFTDLSATLSSKTIATISGVDQDATDLAKAQPSKTVKVEGVAQPDATVYAQTTTKAVATAPDGSSFVVGTTEGALGSNVGTGMKDLFLTKLDSEGKVVWQRQLGAMGQSEGTAVTVDGQGNVIVAGTTDARLNPTDVFAGTDAFVAKYNAAGDELFATQIDGLSETQGKAVAVDAAGNIYLGGVVKGVLNGETGNGSGDAFVVKLSTTGQMLDKVQFGGASSDSVSAMAIHPDGSLIVATTEGGQATVHKLDTASLADAAPSINLGAATISSIAVDSASGQIAIGGTTSSGLVVGTPNNAVLGLNDGFVARLDSGLAASTVTYLGTGAEDQVDSLAFMGGSLYAGGRTSGVLGTARVGSTDGFVARLDASTGAIQNVRQFGTITAKTESVSIAAAVGGDNILGKLGLQQGEIAKIASDKLVTQTSLRAGDSFSIKVGTLREVKITIGADDTIDTLASQLRLATGYRVNMTLSKLSTGNSIKFTAKAGQPIELRSGPAGSDALSKLGLEPQKLEVPKISANKALITPGGAYSLNLDDAFSLTTEKGATYVSGMVEKAIKTVQSAYRSLYWDDTKAALVDGKIGAKPQLSAYQSSRLASYQDAIARMGG